MDAAILDTQGGPVVGASVVEIRMMVLRCFLHGGWQLGEARVVVVSVTFNALNADGGAHGQILQQRNRSDIAEILAAHHNGLAFTPAFFDEATVGDTLKNPFAILVAGSGIAKAQSGGQAVEVGIRFINDNRRSVGPGLKLVKQ